MKTTIDLYDGSTVDADVTRRKLLAIYRADGKGFIVSYVPSGQILLRTNLKRQAIAIRKELEGLDWSDPTALRETVLDAVARNT